MGFDFAFAVQILPLLLQASITTILVTIVAFGMALVGGLVLALLRRGHRYIDAALDMPLEFIRNTPLLVQILFVYLVFPRFGIVWTPFEIGVAVMSLHYSCYLSEVYRAGLESIPAGQYDAAMALNFGTFGRYRSVILPQLVPLVVPAAGNFLIYMFKDSPLLAAISLTELVFVASKISTETFQYLEPMTLVGLIFLAMSLLSAAALRQVEKRIGARWISR
jgi:polar amino acid transport system permease protein